MTLTRRSTLLLALLLPLPGCSPGAMDPDGMAPDCDGEGRSHCVAQVSLGAHAGCAALADRTVWCWGRNDENQLGYESSDLCPERLSNGQTRAVACHAYPLQVAGLSAATAVSVGDAYACALLASGAVRCWGGNTAGQLGNGSSLPSVTPVEVSRITHATAVAAGATHACAIVAGAVQCWGANDRGQLGVETTTELCGSGTSALACARTPVAVAGLHHVVELVAGDAHTCARAQDGTVSCWGTNADGQLGAGTASPMPSPTPRAVLLGTSPLRGVRALAAGTDHTCALRDDGAVLCWGRHDRGQLGAPAPAQSAPCSNACFTTAVAVLGYEGTRSGHTEDGGVDGPVDGGTAEAGAPIDASAADGARADASGVSDTGRRDASAVVPPAVISIAAGGSFSCLSLDDGTLRCWGSNRSNELGDGTVNAGGPALVTVIASPGSAPTNPLQNVRSVESGGTTSCALMGDHTLRCWGSNESGALGIGGVVEQSGPVSVTW